MDTHFIPTRSAALERLTAFLPKSGRTYAMRRNFDLGAGRHADVSCLSPYLRCRLITEQDVLKAVVQQHGLQTAEKFVQEVFWRTYWKGWLELRPSVWDQYRHDLHRAWNDVQTQGGLREQWEAACHGETGIDCFDAWAQELANTGYLHNHARMWFASIWIFTLKLPWTLGADFFLRHLLDGDPASNTLSWRWVAGIQTRGKTYLARTSNISKFTEGRFHPKWQLATDATALDAPTPPEPTVPPASDVPDPALKTGFLLHVEDLDPVFALDVAEIACTAALAPQVNFGPLKTADYVTDFRASLTKDVIDRNADRLGQITHVQDAQMLVAWAREQEIEQIVTPYAPTGPVADCLSSFVSIPGSPRLCRVVRQYDARAWPHCTKGFFGFKKNIPDLTEALLSAVD